MHFGNKTVTEKITVAYDPRVEMPFDVLKAKYDLLKQIESKTDIAGKATEELLKSKAIVEDVNKKAKMLLEKHRGLLNNGKHRGSSNSIDLGEEHGDSGSKHSHYTN